MDFIGFDGNSYNSLDFSHITEQYNHFVLLKNSSADYYYLHVFNDTLDIIHDGSKIILTCDGISNPSYYYCANHGSWITVSSSKGFSYPKCSVVYSDLSEYKDSFLNYQDIHYVHTSSTEPVEPEPIEPDPVEPEPIEPLPDGPVFTSSCVVNDSVSNVNFSLLFSEIFDILPVVLVICISFVSIRKGISFIRNLFVKS